MDVEAWKNVEFTLTPQDFKQFNKFVTSHQQPASKSNSLLRVILPVVVLLAVAFILTSQPHHPLRHSTSGTSPFEAMLESVLIPVVIIFAFWFLMLYVNRKDKGAERPARLSLTDRCLIADIKGVHSEIAWSKIHATGQNSDAIFILLGPIEGYIIPKRAFADEAGASAFFDFVETHTANPVEDKPAPPTDLRPAALVTHTITVDDAKHAHWYWLRRYGRRRVVTTIVGLACLAIGLFAVGIAPMLWHGHPFDAVLVSGTVPMAVVTCFAGYILLGSHGTVANLTKDGPHATTTVALTPDGVSLRSDLSDRRIGWSDIVEVTHDQRLIYFNGPTDIVWIVPLSSFPLPPDVDDFVNRANALRQGEPIDTAVDTASWPPSPSR